jgi:hypothetical protein
MSNMFVCTISEPELVPTSGGSRSEPELVPTAGGSCHFTDNIHEALEHRNTATQTMNRPALKYAINTHVHIK